MNLRERGITVGDLLIIIIFTISTVFIINKFQDRETKAHNFITLKKITTAKNFFNYWVKGKSISSPLQNLSSINSMLDMPTIFII